MSKHEAFKFKSSGELMQRAAELGLDLPFQEEVDPLFEPIIVGNGMAPNRLAVQPMEGCDSEADGSPGALSFRRYKRYAAGGSGLIWFEATSVTPEGRSNPRQLMLNRDTLPGFAELVRQTRQAATAEFGSDHKPYLVLQITHSGRYSKPFGETLGKVGCYNPFLDQNPDSVVQFSDGELDELAETCIEAAGLAYDAGFDSVDIKACHGYLVHELLGARMRQDSRYGGSLKNRARLLCDVVRGVRRRFAGKDVAVRLNATDGIPFPYGFGMDADDPVRVNLAETKELIDMLISEGCSMLNITAGIPYCTPEMVRPFNRPVTGAKLPDEHPLEGVARLVETCSALQADYPDMPFVASGLTWLKHFFPQIGAAIIKAGNAAFIGLGRNSFAYPDSPKDLLQNGRIDPLKSCIACSKCTELMRGNRPAGCVTRDTEIYLGLYKAMIAAGN